MDNCVFCRISSGDLPASVVYDADGVLAFRDINPEAPTHIIAITRQHYPNLAALVHADPALSSRLLAALTELGAEHGSDGYRIVFNTGADAGQSEHHVHAHVLAGRTLNWPPG